MRKLIVSTLAVLALTGQFRTSQAFLDLTVENKTVNAGTSTTLNVIWSSTTALDYLTTDFMITAVGGATSGAVTFANSSGVAPLPPLNDRNYLFSGDSVDAGLLPINPTSVFQTQTGWANDTYNFADSTSSATDYAQNGSRLWTILNIDISNLAAGQYQITLGSSNYTNAANPGGLNPDMTGGLITVNAVPEPSTCVLTAIALVVTVGVSRRKQKSTN